MPKSPDPTQKLRLALDELGRRAKADALDALLHAWRGTRAPAIADLIDALSRQLEAERPALALGGVKQTAWNDALAQATLADLPRLYEALPDTRVGLAYVRLAQLRDRRPDPRLARWLWAWLRDVPFKGAASRQFYVEAAAQLRAIADPRFDAEILAARDGDHTTGHYTVARLRNVGSRTALAAFMQLADEAEERLGSEPWLEAEIAPLIEPLAAKIAELGAAVAKAENTAAELLAAVHAAPEDDTPRLVYADFLQRSGDPRGEFIALQIARHGTDAKPSKRERELAKKYADAWADGLEPFILKSGREFRRGFLAVCRYCHPRVEPNPIGLSAWATIEELDGSAHTYMSGTARIIVQPQMTALRHVRGVSLDDVVALAEHDRPLAIQSLHLRYCDARSLLEILQRARSLPHLRSLDLSECGQWVPVIDTIRAAFPGLTVLPQG